MKDEDDFYKVIEKAKQQSQERRNAAFKAIEASGDFKNTAPGMTAAELDKEVQLIIKKSNDRFWKNDSEKSETPPSSIPTKSQTEN